VKMTRRALVGAAMVTLVAIAPVAASAAFECPVPAPGAAPAQSQAIKAALPAGDAFADLTKLNAAVASLRSQGIGNAIIIDNLIAAYCPTVADNAALTEAQKREAVRRFAGQITRTVYGLESEDAVILDVPFPPNVIAAINARAAAAKISPEAWVAKAIARDVKVRKRR